MTKQAFSILIIKLFALYYFVISVCSIAFTLVSLNVSGGGFQLSDIGLLYSPTFIPLITALIFWFGAGWLAKKLTKKTDQPLTESAIQSKEAFPLIIGIMGYIIVIVSITNLTVIFTYVPDLLSFNIATIGSVFITNLPQFINLVLGLYLILKAQIIAEYISQKTQLFNTPPTDTTTQQ